MNYRITLLLGQIVAYMFENWVEPILIQAARIIGLSGLRSYPKSRAPEWFNFVVLHSSHLLRALCRGSLSASVSSRLRGVPCPCSLDFDRGSAFSEMGFLEIHVLGVCLGICPLVPPPSVYFYFVQLNFLS